MKRPSPTALASNLLGPAERDRAARVKTLAGEGAAGVPKLVAMLDDPSWPVRRLVVEALAELGDVAVNELVHTLETRRDDEARIAATVDALAASVGAAEPDLEALAAHDDPAVLADVGQILGRRRARAAVGTLVELSRHDNDNVAVAALEALGRVGGRAAVETLIEAVRSRSFFRTFPAMDVLGRSGDPRAIEPLVELLDDPQYALEAARALGRTGDVAAVGPLADLLTGATDTAVRIACVALHELRERNVQRLGDTGAIERELRQRAAPAAVRRITAVTAEGGPTEQEAACWVLGTLGDEAAIPALAQLLEGSPATARGAAEALDRIGQAAADEVQRALERGDSDVRRAILPMIASRVHALDGVICCLDDPDPAVRASACEALARMTNPAAVRPLFGCLGDSDALVSQRAITAIQSLGSAETEGIALEAARADDARVRRAAFRILSYFGYPSALDLFLEALEGDDPRLREAAIQGLAFIEDPRALESLLDATRHEEARVRASAMRALAHTQEDLQSRPCLLHGLEDEDGWVRYYACQSLGKLAFAPAAEAIAARLEDEAGQVRVAAVEALAQLPTPIAREHLSEAVRSSEPDVQRAALLGLGIARRREHLPLIMAATQSPDPATRLVAISALSGFQAPEVIDALEAAAGDDDEGVRNAAIGFLASRGTEEATLRLLRITTDDGDFESPVIEALGTYSAGRVRGLLSALEEADEELAAVIASALARMQRPEAKRALLDTLEAGTVIARKAAATAMSSSRAPEVMAALDRAATADPDPQVRRVCAALRSR